MIINCGKRRLVSDRFGWKIEIQHVYGKDSKKAGETYWTEDRPAYPANLPQACEMLCERIAKESEGDTPDGLVKALKDAAIEVKQYMETAKGHAIKLQL